MQKLVSTTARPVNAMCVLFVCSRVHVCFVCVVCVRLVCTHTHAHAHRSVDAAKQTRTGRRTKLAHGRTVRAEHGVCPVEEVPRCRHEADVGCRRQQVLNLHPAFERLLLRGPTLNEVAGPPPAFGLR